MPVVLLERALDGRSQPRRSGQRQPRRARHCVLARPERWSGFTVTRASQVREAHGPGHAPFVYVVRPATRCLGDPQRQERRVSSPQEGAVLLVDTTKRCPSSSTRVTRGPRCPQGHGITTIKEISFSRAIRGRRETLDRVPSANPEYRDGLLARLHEFMADPGSQHQNRAERPFISAGYAADEQLRQLDPVRRVRGLAEFVPTRLIRKAITTAVAARSGAGCADVASRFRSFSTTRPRTDGRQVKVKSNRGKKKSPRRTDS